MIKSYREYIWITFFYIAIAAFSFSGILLRNGVVGLRTDWPIPPLNIQLRIALNDLQYPIVGYLGLGEARLREFGVLMSYIINSGVYLFDANGDVISKINILIPVILSMLTMTILLKEGYHFATTSAIIGALFYAYSPLIFNSAVNGFIKILWAYPFIPLALFFYRILLSKYIIENKVPLLYVWLTSTVAGFSYSDDHFLLFTPLLIITYWMYYCFKLIAMPNSSIPFRKIAISFTVTLVILLSGMLLQGNAMTTLLLSTSTTLQFVPRAIVHWNTFLAPEPLLSYSMKGGGYTYFHQIAAGINFWIVLRFLLIALTFVPVISVKFTKEKDSYYFILLIIFSLLILNRTNPPFSQINKLLFEYFPLFFSVTRDVQYVTVFMSLAYGVLISNTTQLILERLLTKTRRDLVSSQKRKNTKLATIAFLILLIIVILNGPMIYYLGSYSQFTSYKLDDHYSELIDKISLDAGSYRVWMLPYPQPLQYKDIPYPFFGQDPLMVFPKTVIASYSTTSHVNFLTMALLSGWTKYLGTLESLLGIKYNIMRFDMRTQAYRYWWPEFPKADFWSNDKFNISLSKQDDLRINPYFSEKSRQLYLTYENFDYSSLVEVWDGYYVASGDLGLYVMLSYYLQEFLNVSRIPPIVFAQNYITEPELYLSLMNESKGYIVLEGNYMDLVLPLIHNKKIIWFADFADSTYYKSGFMPLDMGWGLGLPFTTSIETGIITATNNPLKAKFSVNKTDKYDIFIKTLANSISNDDIIEMIIDGQKMKPVYLGFGYTKYAVLKNLTLTAGEHEMMIQSAIFPEPVGLCNALVIKSGKFDKALETLYNLMLSKEVIYVYKFSIPWKSIYSIPYEATFGLAYDTNLIKTLGIFDTVSSYKLHARVLEKGKVMWITRNVNVVTHSFEAGPNIPLNLKGLDFIIVTKGLTNIADLPKEIPTYNYHQENPCRFEISLALNDSEDQHHLVVLFKNEWQSYWKISSPAVNEALHFVAHGFANGWIVRTLNQKSDNISLRVYCSLEQPYSMGLLLSVAYLVVPIMTIGGAYMYKKWKNLMKIRES